MIINDASLASLFTGFNAAFKQGFAGAESHYRDVAMVVPSSTSSNTYGWLGQFPKMREWVGDRIVKNLSAHGYVLENRSFETTVAAKRTQIEDDQFGIYQPMMQEMGKSAAELPDEMVFSLAKNGFSTKCYDGQYFFDADHPVLNPLTGQIESKSNIAAGAGEAWYLLDTTRPMKPFLYQERRPFVLTSLTDERAPNVFWRDEYVYGCTGRANAGYGLWQLAYASKQPLDAAGYKAARTAMRELKGDEGRILGVKPSLLIVPPSLEEAANKLLNSEHGPGGETNPWKGTAKLIVTPWIL